VTEKSYEVAHIDELDRFPVVEGLLWRPVRRRLGIRAFGTNAYTAENTGDRVVEEHYERDGAEELYFVARGRAKFVLGDDELEAPAGTFVRVEPGTRRGAHALEPGTAVVAFGAKRGVPHEISAWEEIFVAFGHLKNGDEEAGRQAFADVLEASPDAWQGYYNAACFEALTGHKDAAIEHLKKAIELEPEAARQAAAGDEDFDAYRDDPEFASAIAGQPDTSGASS
jgi:mannose-6-phosphate isomerase-like protein (cupin superfamily)